MQTVPLPDSEAARLRALRRYEILDTPAEAEFDDLTHLASQICGTPIALISLVDEGRQWFKSRRGLEATETPRDVAFCAHTITQDGIFEVPDARADERFRENPMVKPSDGIRFYAGVPLTTPDGHNLGALCVKDRVPQHLTAEQRDALTRLGRQVVRQMELRLTRAAAKRHDDQTLAFQSAVLGLRDYAGDEEGLFRRVTAAMAHALQVARASVWLFDATRATLVCHDLYRTDTWGHERGLRLAAVDFPRYFAAIQNHQAVVAHDAQTHPDTSEFTAVYLQPLGITAMLDVPIRVGAQLAGVLCCEHVGPPRQWLPEEERFAVAVTSYVMLALEAAERRRVTEELRQANTTLEQRVAERTAALALREERLRILVEQAADAVLVHDANGNIMEANQRAGESLGYSREELLTMTLADVDPDFAPVEARQLWASLQPGGPVTLEGRQRRRDGTCFAVEIRLGCFAVDRQRFFLALVRDITDRRLAEETRLELTRLLDQARDAILVRDLEDRILYWNKGAERLYGWTASEALGRDAVGLLFKERSPAVDEAQQRVMAAGEWQGEMRQVTKAGKALTVESRWTLVRDATGRPKARLVINTDITEKKQLEAQFLRVQRMESLGTLAGGVAHDLNNVLAPILMSVELLQNMFPEEQHREVLETIESSAKRGSAIVRQILSFARGTEDDRTEVQLKHLVTELAGLCRDTFPKFIQIRKQFPSQLWPVRGDATQIYQVLINLCVNARDAMPHGGQLTISTENVELDGQLSAQHPELQTGPFVLLSVTDTGTGMTPEVREKIFDPFFTTKEIGKGTGLGLSTVLGIVKSHGGFLEIVSAVGRGTTFKVFLPAVTSAATRTAAAAPAKAPAGNGELVLVVDDEQSIRVILQSILDANGYSVLTACDGSEALTVFGRNQGLIQAVITDIAMPVMDGGDVIRVLRRMQPDLRFIATSGHAENVNVLEVAKGNARFLPKPFTAQSVLQCLHDLLAAPPATGGGAV